VTVQLGVRLALLYAVSTSLAFLYKHRGAAWPPT
jgi:hypothetical protein